MLLSLLFFFFNAPATTEIYTLSLHDALPISGPELPLRHRPPGARVGTAHASTDRKSTRLNSSHQIISYAVFCLKKKSQTYSIKFRSTCSSLPRPVFRPCAYIAYDNRALAPRA